MSQVSDQLYFAASIPFFKAYPFHLFLFNLIYFIFLFINLLKKNLMLFSVWSLLPSLTKIISIFFKLRLVRNLLIFSNEFIILLSSL